MVATVVHVFIFQGMDAGLHKETSGINLLSFKAHRTNCQLSQLMPLKYNVY